MSQMFVQNYLKEIISENQQEVKDIQSVDQIYEDLFPSLEDEELLAEKDTANRMIKIASGLYDYFKDFPEQAAQFDTKEKLNELISFTEKEYFHSESDCPIATNIEFAIDKIQKRAIQKREETKMAEATKNATERKTADLAKGDDFLHSYNGSKVLNGYIVSEPKFGTITTPQQNTLSFRISTKPLKDGKTQEGAYTINVKFRADEEFNKSQIEDAYRNSKPVMLSGRVFEQNRFDYVAQKELPDQKIDVFFGRSLHEATIETDENGKTKYSVAKDTAPLVSKEQITGREFMLAANQRVTGYVFESEHNKFNIPLVDPQTQNVFGYAHSFFVSSPKMQDGHQLVDDKGKKAFESIHVSCKTKCQMDKNDIVSTKDALIRQTFFGATQRVDFQDAQTKEWKNNVRRFEPTYWARNKEVFHTNAKEEKSVEKETEQANER